MLACFSRCSAKVLRRAQSAIRAFGDVIDNDKERVHHEAPLVFSRPGSGKHQIEVLQVEGEAHPALALLESSVQGAPLPSSSKPRFAQLPPPRECNRVLARAAEDPGAASRAAEVAEALVGRGVTLEAGTLKALVSGLARADALPEALPVLDAWLQQQEEALADDAAAAAPLAVLSQLLDAAARGEQTQLMLHVLARMARIGVTPSPQSLTTLLQCFVRLGQAEVAHQVLDWMRRNELGPSVYAYTALLAPPRDAGAAAARRQLELAQLAYSKLREDGVAPNARFFTELIRACGRAGDLQAAEAVWADVSESGVEPDLILYSAMLDACAKCKDGAAALRVFEDMRARGVSPDVVAYTSLLVALQGAPQPARQAREAWRAMQADGVPPNGAALAALLEILLAEGEVDEALAALAAAAPGGGTPPPLRRPPAWQRKTAAFVREAGLVPTPAAESLITAHAAAAGGGAAGSGSRLQALIDLPRLYEHFLFATAHRGQHEVVEQIARHMRARGLPHTLGTVAALLTAAALRRGHPAAKWLLQPPGAARGGGASAATVLLPDEVVEACLLGRGSALTCMHKLMASASSGGSSDSSGGGGGQGGFTMGRTLANVILAGLASQGCAAEAVQLYDWMKAQGLERQRRQREQAAEQQRQQRLPPPCSPDAWTQQLLLFAALNAPPELRLELTLLAVKEAREAAAAGGGSSKARVGWDRRTRSAILSVMRQSEQAQQLLGAQVDATADEREERLRQLTSMMR